MRRRLAYYVVIEGLVCWLYETETVARAAALGYVVDYGSRVRLGCRLVRA